VISVKKQNKNIIGSITLDASKSISNRILIINALCNEKFKINNLSTSKDTVTLVKLLKEIETNAILDAGAAGTTYRFMTAYLALQSGTQTLTGSERMKQRPIGKLVAALRTLGANIEYLENEGYPPLKIGEWHDTSTKNLSIAADTSSQYISALLMIAPRLPQGLELTLEGTIVSRPYIEMTLSLMESFGVKSTWEGHTITILPQHYTPRDFTVEADWSAASYYYAMAAMADELNLKLIGLQKNSLQGDSVVAEMMEGFGVKTRFYKNSLRLTKSKNKKQLFQWDFLRCPDIAQTLAVACGAVGKNGIFTGLETLYIKETDRVAALKNELRKVDVTFVKLPKSMSKKSQKEYFMTEGAANLEKTPTFFTYEDHRMAMAFAPLAMLGDIQIEHPEVVEKSYPQFWEDLKLLGFEISDKF
jgi:3-phosphoshikimate 1-carboxyvinyltransferase